MDTEDFAYVCMCYGPGELADLEYLSSCQFGVRTKMPESMRKPVFLNSVVDIVDLCSQEQMFGINTMFMFAFLLNA